MPYKDPLEAKARKRAQYLLHREALLRQKKIYNDAHREERNHKATSRRLSSPEKYKAKDHASYQKRRATILAKKRLAYAANPQRFLAQSKKSYQKHRQARLAQERENRLNKRQWRREYETRYRRAHPEKIKAKSDRRRAQRAQAPINDFTVAQWQEMKAAYGHTCAYCGRKMQRLSQDHITPLSKGGTHTASNIVPACQSCNSQKHTGPVPVPVQPLLLTVAPSKPYAPRPKKAQHPNVAD